MKITCTVEEFGQMVRACENTSRQVNCRSCPLNGLCDRMGDKKIEQFIASADVVASLEEKSEAMNKHYRPAGWPLGGYQPAEKPKRLIPPVGSGGEDG